jgi:pyridoxamine 5'-phosphate oxidase
MNDFTLSEQDAAADPFEQFDRWYQPILREDLVETGAMTLATVDAQGRPVARIVGLRGHDRRGFVFYTNYQGRKARELEASGRAALLFYWDRFHRQVRIEGRVERVTAAESDAYFATRPRGSQIGAWASPQSETLADRRALEALCAEIERRHAGGQVPRPPHWGGYRVVPEYFEFWQGRDSRLHDRIVYTPGADGGWMRSRLAP